MPLGPSVLFTRSAMAMAPTKEACRGSCAAGQQCHRGPQQQEPTLIALTSLAFSPFSSCAPAASTDCVKLEGICKQGKGQQGGRSMPGP